MVNFIAIGNKHETVRIDFNIEEMSIIFLYLKINIWLCANYQLYRYIHMFYDVMVAEDPVLIEPFMLDEPSTSWFSSVSFIPGNMILELDFKIKQDKIREWTRFQK